MKRFYGSIGLVLAFYNTALYAASLQDAINQSNSNADRIVAQSQANITQQQQILAQRLQALSAAMQARNPNSPIVVQAVPAPVRPAPIAPPAVKATPVVTTPRVATTPDATGLTPPSQNNNGNDRNQWNYGF